MNLHSRRRSAIESCRLYAWFAPGFVCPQVRAVLVICPSSVTKHSKGSRNPERIHNCPGYVEDPRQQIIKAPGVRPEARRRKNARFGGSRKSARFGGTRTPIRGHSLRPTCPPARQSVG